MNLEQFLSGTERSKANRIRRTKPLAEITGGSALAVYGLTRRSITGAGLAAVGGWLVYRGIRTSRDGGLSRAIHVERSFTILRPKEELFRYWRNFENLPRFMRHLKSVQSLGEKTSRWEARAPMGMSIGWDAEIIDERENHYIVWHSLAGSLVPNRGSVEFRDDPAHGGTQVKVAIDYDPPGGRMGRMIAKMFGEEPEQQIREDLRHFKQLMEAGEIPTIENQPSGRRTPWVRMIQAATAENTTMQERSA